MTNDEMEQPLPHKGERILHPAQIAAYRRMSVAEKLDLAARLRRTAKELKAAALRDKHPDWDEARVQEEVKRIFLRAVT